MMTATLATGGYRFYWPFNYCITVYPWSLTSHECTSGSAFPLEKCKLVVGKVQGVSNNKLALFQQQAGLRLREHSWLFIN